jgi:hypothetical protein
MPRHEVNTHHHGRIGQVRGPVNPRQWRQNYVHGKSGAVRQGGHLRHFERPLGYIPKKSPTSSEEEVEKHQGVLGASAGSKPPEMAAG